MLADEFPKLNRTRIMDLLESLESDWKIQFVATKCAGTTFFVLEIRPQSEFPVRHSG